MKKLLLLDADVVIDLHTLGIFERVSKAYKVSLTEKVFSEAKFYPRGNQNFPIRLKGKVRVIRDIQTKYLRVVNDEEREARLRIGPGEATSIAYLLQSSEEVIFCTCDKTAMRLISFMNLEEKAISLEKALKDIGYSGRLFSRHREEEFKKEISEGKTLRIWYKNLK